MRIFAVAAVVLACGTARAQNLEPLRHDLTLDVAITGVGAAAWLSSELLFKHQLAPQTCRWCQPDGFDTAVRDELRWSNPHTADVLSNVGAFGLLPLATLGGAALAGHHDGARGETIGVDMLVIGESAILAQDVNQAVKFAVGRERPFVHALPDGEKPLTAMPDDNNLSFFSGHTTWAFSLATAAGTVCTMHGYKFAPEVWAGGLTFATATALLRIGADKHYATDVLTGALVGSAFGIGVPRLFHALQSPSTSAQQQLGLALQPAMEGMTMGVSGRF